MEKVSLRVMTYNIHHGEGNDKVVDLQRIAEVILAEDPDIVTLQELDRFWNRSGGVDQPAELARLLGMNMSYGVNDERPPDHSCGKERAYGVATYTRFPIIGSVNTHLPITSGWEARGVLDTRVDAPGIGEISILNVHLQSNANGEASEAGRQRRQQTQAIAGRVAATDDPIVLMGDFNAEPQSGDLNALVGQGGEFADTWLRSGAGEGRTRPTSPDADPVERIDLILHSAVFVSKSATVVRNTRSQMASDHYPVVAELTAAPV